MALAITPLLRFGPGGDFLADVSPERLSNHSGLIASNEHGSFEPNSEGPGGQAWAGDSRPGPDDPRRTSQFRADAFTVVDDAGAPGSSDARDVPELSGLARRAGGLMVAQRVLDAQCSAVKGVFALMATLRANPPASPWTAADSRRVVRHTPDHQPLAPDSPSPGPQAMLRAAPVATAEPPRTPVRRTSEFPLPTGKEPYEPHPQAAQDPPAHPRQPRADWLFPDDAGARRRARRQQGNGLRAR